LSPTFALVGFQKVIQQSIPQVEISLKDDLISLLAIIRTDNVQRNLKHKV
jgi:hypothetical protein